MPLITGTQSLLLAHNKQREKYQLGKNDSCARSAGMEVSHAIRLVGVSPENDMTEKCIFQDEKYQTCAGMCCAQAPKVTRKDHSGIMATSAQSSSWINTLLLTCLEFPTGRGQADLEQYKDKHQCTIT